MRRVEGRLYSVGQEWLRIPKPFVIVLAGAGRILIPPELLVKAFGAEYRDDLQYLRDWIINLRKKIEDDPKNPKYITTLKEIGYMFDAPKEKK